MPKRLTKKAYRTRQEAFDKEFGGGKAARLIELGGAYTDAKAAKAFFSELDTSKPGEAEPPYPGWVARQYRLLTGKSKPRHDNRVPRPDLTAGKIRAALRRAGTLAGAARILQTTPDTVRRKAKKSRVRIPDPPPKPQRVYPDSTIKGIEREILNGAASVREIGRRLGMRRDAIRECVAAHNRSVPREMRIILPRGKSGGRRNMEQIVIVPRRFEYHPSFGVR
ncbi:MAG: hypothetical protein A3B37_00695 [Candidatus Sungbacteria bacterium RIFCSPLOWO2_01_FULL_59_16]|uniref:Uncharacterized protein n=1 Tax=Candidatus Sungbacteria bacterium RIFCSPLOWO2_01_FULL_59_16 TaxID=1802280 RepID=A0A1G2LDG3_9BACT|nr:MAG: hypothetical protein A3B37_00695 [Candidatus Sungbacteria bacterium RIFCSPLOWO2_01_FULL_59_16]